MNKQNELLQHTTTIYLNNQIAEYAKELADKMPGDLKVRVLGIGIRCSAACGNVSAGLAAHPVLQKLNSSRAACLDLCLCNKTPMPLCCDNGACDQGRE